VATAIFFESNGGQAKADATQPEIRLAVAEPSLDIGNVETALESLAEACYYLAVERNRYRFTLRETSTNGSPIAGPASQPNTVDECIREEIQKVFAAGARGLPRRRPLQAEARRNQVSAPRAGNERRTQPVLNTLVMGDDIIEIKPGVPGLKVCIARQRPDGFGLGNDRRVE